jgi:acetyl-CoA acetyltransferase
VGASSPRDIRKFDVKNEQNGGCGTDHSSSRLGATGLAQCSELCWQLRGECGPRQVKGAKVGLQHNLGLGGAVVVSYKYMCG